MLKTNKPLTLYEHPEGSYVVCVASRRDGDAVLSGHADGSLHVFYFDSGTGPAGTAKFAHHSCPPSAVAWGAEALLVTGSDCKVKHRLRPHNKCDWATACWCCHCSGLQASTVADKFMHCRCASQSKAEDIHTCSTSYIHRPGAAVLSAHNFALDTRLPVTIGN